MIRPPFPNAGFGQLFLFLGAPYRLLLVLRHILGHFREREEIATAGKARTLRDHSYAIPAQELDAIIRGELPKWN